MSEWAEEKHSQSQMLCVYLLKWCWENSRGNYLINFVCWSDFEQANLHTSIYRLQSLYPIRKCTSTPRVSLCGVCRWWMHWRLPGVFEMHFGCMFAALCFTRYLNGIDDFLFRWISSLPPPTHVSGPTACKTVNEAWDSELIACIEYRSSGIPLRSI